MVVSQRSTRPFAPTIYHAISMLVGVQLQKLQLENNISAYEFSARSHSAVAQRRQSTARPRRTVIPSRWILPFGHSRTVVHNGKCFQDCGPHLTPHQDWGPRQHSRRIRGSSISILEPTHAFQYTTSVMHEVSPPISRLVTPGSHCVSRLILQCC